ncbi:MAG: carbamoyltransferase HypF [Kofleriaceae bacterium]
MTANAHSAGAYERARVRVRGLVQGVGFRPFVYGLANQYALSGWVLNDDAGVLLEVEGEATEAFLRALRAESPPLARVDAVEVEWLAIAPARAGSTTGGPSSLPGFEIRESAHVASVSTGIGADAAPCLACLQECFDPANRRYRYPFLNCTHCGPRFTITKHLPYDRAQTSMAPFPMCAACADEYGDPRDRRFHAQPTACPRCGPALAMPLEAIAARLRRGEIVAIKGLGGFHIACDATNGDAVRRLRRAKQRDGKPFAVMVPGVASARAWVTLSAQEAQCLASVRRPIVLARCHAHGGLDLALDPAPDLAWLGGRELAPDLAPDLAWLGGPELAPDLAPDLAWLSGRELLAPDLARLGGTGLAPDLARDLAPDLAWLGVMLPSSPLHYLIFHELLGRPSGTAWLEEAHALALVMTSANPGGEPLVRTDEDAEERLSGICDAIAGHDRAIVVRCDDPVVRFVSGSAVTVRRGRGFVPDGIELGRQVPSVLAVGAYLNNAVCVTRQDRAYLSQHVGDMDDAETFRFFEQTIEHLLAILEVEPIAVAHDLHPDFLSTRYAQRIGIPCVPVQHHHAHLAAVIAEHGRSGPHLGLALDGVGLGNDLDAWGGELLRVDGARFERVGHLAPLPLPGGDVAAREPWRMAIAALHRMGRTAEITRRFGHQGAIVASMLAAGVNCPPATGCGRWFDAACGLLGVRDRSGYEGEAPMVLESLVRAPRVLAGAWTLDAGVLDLLPLLDALCEMSPQDGADAFHGTLAAALVDLAMPALGDGGTIALGGGCVVNAVLVECLVGEFAKRGVEVLLPRLAPPGDGGLALGQAVVCAFTLEQGAS